jgi:hypothetical protein
VLPRTLHHECAIDHCRDHRESAASGSTAIRGSYRRHPWIAASGATIGVVGTALLGLYVAVEISAEQNARRFTNSLCTAGCPCGDNPFAGIQALIAIAAIPFLVPGSLLLFLGLIRRPDHRSLHGAGFPSLRLGASYGTLTWEF